MEMFIVGLFIFAYLPLIFAAIDEIFYF